MQKRWVFKNNEHANATESLAKELSVDPILAGLLTQRGITTYAAAKSFFRPELKDLHDPFLMKDMDAAANRVLKALENDERILVYGDYDVDGTTSVALMYSFLNTFTDNIDYYIPDRYAEGYGISIQSIDFAADNDFSLIIALDCGIKAVEKVAYAKEKGIDYIICDHHRPGDTIPDTVAVLDPKREDCEYPFKELSGAGVGFKLVQAIAIKKEIPFSELEQYLDLLAISIAADMVPMTGENRILAYWGIKQVNEAPRKGIKAMLDLAAPNKSKFTVTDMVFIVAPRINAAGRIDSAKKAVDLLLSGNATIAKRSSEIINIDNKNRQDLDRAITEEALTMIRESEALTNAKSTLLYDDNWHKGVVGIVASRLIENYFRPTIVLTKSSDGVAAGSARSVKGFDVYNAIEACGDLLTQFGGHKYAAGMTLPIENVPAFRKKFEEVVTATILPEQLTPVIEIDAELLLEEITPKFYRVLSQFAPFGPGNMTPVFKSEKLKDNGSAFLMGKESKTHLKLTVQQPLLSDVEFTAVAFGQANHFEHVYAGNEFDLAYSIDVNEWRGASTLQLMVKDLDRKKD